MVSKAPTHRDPITPSNLKPTLRSLLERMAANANGIGPGEVTGWAFDQVREACYRLCTDGRLHRAKLPRTPARYFATAEAAAAYLQANRAVAGHCVTQSGRVMQHTPRHQRAWWPADAPAVETDRTRYTYAKPPERALRTNTHSEWGG